MIKHKWIGVIAVLLMAAAVLGVCIAAVNPAALTTVTGMAQAGYISVMDKAEVMSVQIIAEDTKWADMLKNATAEEYIPATVIINGDKLENVGIRPKGNSSLSMVAQDSTTDRYSFKIEFDHYIDGQTWRGLDKLALNNMQGDASYMKEYLSYDIMDYIGVSVPLYAYADISVNGDVWGFYLAIECLEESYAQRVYGNNHGKLYKPESMGIRGEGRMNEFLGEMQNGAGAAPQGGGQGLNEGGVQERMGRIPTTDGQQEPQWQPGGEMQNLPNNRGGGFGGGMASSGVSLQYTGDEISGYSAIFDNSVFKASDSDYKRVIGALKKLSNGEDLESAVDVEATLKYFAAHTVVVNLDSYVSGMGHNYYLYEQGGQLTMLPWDYNLSFGGFQSGNASSVVNFPIDTPVSGVSMEDRPILGKLLEVPEYLELYHGYLRQITDGYFNSGLFEQTIISLNTMISPYIKNDPTAFYSYEAYETAVQELTKLGLLRAESIEGQLDGVIPSTSAGQSEDSSKLIDASGINMQALGSMGGGMGGWGERTGGGAGNMGIPQAGMGGQRPDNMPGGANNAAGREAFLRGDVMGRTAEYDVNSWLLIAGSAVLLIVGVAFVLCFKRRRPG